VAMLHRIIKGEIPSPRTVKPEVTERMESVVMKALTPNREGRYETAADFQSELEELFNEIGERVVVRDIGKLVAKTFEQDRTKIKSVIEAQIKKGPTHVLTLPSMENMTVSGLHSTSSRSSLPSLKESFTQSGLLAPERTTSVGQKSATPSIALTASSNPPEPKKRSMLLFGVVAVAVAAGAFWMVKGKSMVEPPAPAATTAPQTATTTTVATAPEATEVEIRITANPPEAHFFIDDKPVTGNPWAGKFPRGSGAHRIRAEAPGYGARTRTVTFESNLMVEFALEKEKESTSSRSNSPGPYIPPPPPPPADDMKPAGGKKPPSRTLDSTNPYAN